MAGAHQSLGTLLRFRFSPRGGAVFIALFLKKHWWKLMVVVALVVLVLFVYYHFFNQNAVVNRYDTVTQPTAAQIVEITPIVEECRAVVRAEIPTIGEAQYVADLILGSLTLNTDTIKALIVADVGTCFAPEAVVSITQADGSWTVTIDATKTVFLRPRVDAQAVQTSVSYTPGAGRRAASFVPLFNLFLSTNADDLTVEAMAFAQSVVTSSPCMEAAWEPSKLWITEAYKRQAVAKGITAPVTVIFNGEPDFEQADEVFDVEDAFGSNVTFEVSNDAASCNVASGLALPSVEGLSPVD